MSSGVLKQLMWTNFPCGITNSSYRNSISQQSKSQNFKHFQTRFQKHKTLTQTKNTLTLEHSSFKHPNPHSTKDAPLISGQKTLSHPLSLRTKSVNLTLLSKSRLSLPFCQNPSLFVSFQHPRLIYIPLTKV